MGGRGVFVCRAKRKVAGRCVPGARRGRERQRRRPARSRDRRRWFGFLQERRAKVGDSRHVRRGADRDWERDRPEEPDQRGEDGQGPEKSQVEARRGRGAVTFGTRQRFASQHDVRAQRFEVGRHRHGVRGRRQEPDRERRGRLEGRRGGRRVRGHRPDARGDHRRGKTRGFDVRGEQFAGGLGGVASRAASAGRRHGRAHQRHGHARGPRQAHGRLARRRARRHETRARERERDGRRFGIFRWSLGRRRRRRVPSSEDGACDGEFIRRRFPRRFRACVFGGTRKRRSFGSLRVSDGEVPRRRSCARRGGGRRPRVARGEDARSSAEPPHRQDQRRARRRAADEPGGGGFRRHGQRQEHAVPAVHPGGCDQKRRRTRDARRRHAAASDRGGFRRAARRERTRREMRQLRGFLRAPPWHFAARRGRVRGVCHDGRFAAAPDARPVARGRVARHDRRSARARHQHRLSVSAASRAFTQKARAPGRAHVRHARRRELQRVLREKSGVERRQRAVRRRRREFHSRALRARAPRASAERAHEAQAPGGDVLPGGPRGRGGRG
mmetsp:Transcript_6496/g.26309  ORF Transcript_6496/g.26309 Transcript_6496/m.26309 type:complete len:557 (-) Transcript_6496:2104-3774(-)